VLSPEDVRRLIALGESENVEFKESTAAGDSIPEVVCAFANNLRGDGCPGLLVVGLRDDGSCANSRIADTELKWLADVCSSGAILPRPSVNIFKAEIDGCSVALVEVAAHGAPPVSFKGRVYVRLGPTTRLGSPEDERRLVERRRVANLPYDYRAVPGASIDDLLISTIENVYIPAAFNGADFERNDRALTDKLRALRVMASSQEPSVGGLLAFGKDPEAWIPGAYVQFVRYDGLNLTDPIQNEKKLTGPLVSTLEELDDLLKSNVRTSLDIRGGDRDVKRADYPIRTLQQLSRNAVMHRSYDASFAPIRIYWFSDRVEISSPGGFFGQVNSSNFGSGVTDYRNPLIAEILRNLGYVQRFGYGLVEARRELEANGNRPFEFEDSPTTVLLRVYSV